MIEVEQLTKRFWQGQAIDSVVSCREGEIPGLTAPTARQDHDVPVSPGFKATE